ncbi:hypothetical protein MHY01S_23380 [Meiothermus hypogaeus NBRC 106114]|uniref:Uncharacterized protein n=1 Tax=Meiothermus hypogaeus NBRC 106114 TaxID=1227553 RepID=A0A511R5J2_9DEIN|nr:hypothetical protein MHY01S_23380 [Meiothermus hypogaeus NBRC 106114]
MVVFFWVCERDRFQGSGSIPFTAILVFLYLADVPRMDVRASYTLFALGGHGVAGCVGAYWLLVALG